MQYHMTEDELHQVQAVETELLGEVDRICRKHRIHYNMVGGTMLGAIRHGRHIPWDDDADVGFLRAEYERFREICKKELDPEKYYFQDLRDTEGYRWGYGKLRKKGTEFIRLQQEFMPYEQGIFIDLFPMDNVPDTIVGRKVQFFLCYLLRKCLWSKVGRVTETNRLHCLLYSWMSLIPERTLIHWYEAMVRQNARKKTDMVRILTFPAPKGTYGFYRKWFLERAAYPFANLRLAGARDYEGYLKHKFGDYMKFPPESERKIHPISRLRLPETAKE